MCILSVTLSRLKKLKPLMVDKVRQMVAPSGVYAGVAMLDRILDVQKGQRCVVIGTVYKDMQLKPSILDEYSTSVPAPAVENATSDSDKYVHATFTSCFLLGFFCSCMPCPSGDVDSASDVFFSSPCLFLFVLCTHHSLVLEDEFGRMALSGDLQKLNVHELVTGVVIAVVGEEGSAGTFEVSDVIVMGLPPQPKLPTPASSSPSYLLLTSGIKVGGQSGTKGDHHIALQLMCDYVTGLAGQGEEVFFFLIFFHVLLSSVFFALNFYYPVFLRLSLLVFFTLLSIQHRLSIHLRHVNLVYPSAHLLIQPFALQVAIRSELRPLPA